MIHADFITVAIDRLRFYLLLGWLLPVVALAGGQTESLEYGVVYRGLFSMGTDMGIADAVLESRRADDGQLVETRLEATSAAYPVVESLYPLRYRFRTWLGPEGELVAFEAYEKTTRLRHRLYLRDDSEPGVRRLDLTRPGAGTEEIQRLDAGQPPQQLGDIQSRLLDRLGLLQQVRVKPLHAGAAYRFRVTDGRKRFDYTVRVEKAEDLQLGEVTIPAWKVRFEGSRTKDSGEVVEAHRPLHVWLSRAPGHIPLRVDSHNAIGLFQIELKDPQRLQQIAGLNH
jgi:hypothetical protein